MKKKFFVTWKMENMKVEIIINVKNICLIESVYVKKII